MRDKKRLLVDVSSLYWTCLLQGKDEEFGREVEHNGRTVNVNGWQHGYENAVNSVAAVWKKEGIAPKDTIMVYETGNSKGYRRRFLPTYCEGRSDSRPDAAYEEFHKLSEKLQAELAKVGVTFVTRAHIEADDVLAFLAQNLDGQKIIMSNDRDLAVLLSDDVALWQQGEKVVENPYGPWPVSWIPIYKALVGDASDKIPGAKGFGAKAWLDLIHVFGQEGIEVMGDLIRQKRLHELAEDVAELKVLQRVIDKADDVYASYAADLLYPEECDKLHQPMVWSPTYVHDRTEVDDARLRPYAGISRVVHAGNYDEAVEFMTQRLETSEFVSLDLETYTDEDSDDWLASSGNAVDVLASKIVSCGITFGHNQQYNFYFTVDHAEEKDVKNLNLDQLKAVIELIPKDMDKVIANFANFEAVVLRKNLGDLQGEYFLPKAVDVQLEASYVDENTRRGLKFLTKHYLGVDQIEYDDVTQGRKMNELTARETLEYGAGDTLFTSALHTYFRIRMEVEGVAGAFDRIERDPAYLVAHGFLHGIGFDFERLLEIEAEDHELSEKAWEVLQAFLTKKGVEGITMPVFDSFDDVADIKAAYEIIFGEPLKSRIRTASKLEALLAADEDDDIALFGKMLGAPDSVNAWIARTWKPSRGLDTKSPKQMRDFLYGLCDLPVWLANPPTDKERAEKPDLMAAWYKFNDFQRGKFGREELSAEEWRLIKQKASTDDAAVKFAIKYDANEELKPVLQALQTIKETGTRQSLFYTPYKGLLYWQDRNMHPSIRQSDTTTRRFNSAKPNTSQLSKLGEGVKVRSCIVGHKSGAMVGSMDFSAQELRGQAALSKDEAFISCYVGENKKDLHSVTAAQIAKVAYDEFRRRLASENHDEAKVAKDQRTDAKPVNFLSSYGGTEVALSADMTIPQWEAKPLLEAKREAFPGYEAWSAEQKNLATRNGYTLTVNNVRRHVHAKVLSRFKWEVNAAARSAANFPIQGSSAEQTKITMGAVWRSGILLKYDMRFYMPIHDELVFSFMPEDAPEILPVIHDCMTQDFWPGIPSVSSVSIGWNFADQVELGENIDLDRLKKVIKELREERNDR